MPKLSKEEIESLNFCLAHTQTMVSGKPAYDGTRDDMQKELDKAKTVVAKLKAQK